jgi:c-di-GMP-binding flagellar brake protein YcgR
MEKDRRNAPRVRVNLSARWEGALSNDKATITDLSRTGCFVLSGGKVQVRELIWLEIELPDHRLLHFWAEVVDEASEIGFAVKFNSTSEADQESLCNYIAEVFESPPIKRDT